MRLHPRAKTTPSSWQAAAEPQEDSEPAPVADPSLAHAQERLQDLEAEQTALTNAGDLFRGDRTDAEVRVLRENLDRLRQGAERPATAARAGNARAGPAHADSGDLRGRRDPRRPQAGGRRARLRADGGASRTAGADPIRRRPRRPRRSCRRRICRWNRLRRRPVRPIPSSRSDSPVGRASRARPSAPRGRSPGRRRRGSRRARAPHAHPREAEEGPPLPRRARAAFAEPRDGRAPRQRRHDGRVDRGDEECPGTTRAPHDRLLRPGSRFRRQEAPLGLGPAPRLGHLPGRARRGRLRRERCARDRGARRCRVGPGDRARPPGARPAHRLRPGREGGRRDRPPRRPHPPARHDSSRGRNRRGRAGRGSAAARLRSLRSGRSGGAASGRSRLPPLRHLSASEDGRQPRRGPRGHREGTAHDLDGGEVHASARPRGGRGHDEALASPSAATASISWRFRSVGSPSRMPPRRSRPFD